MSDTYLEGEEIENQDYTERPLAKGEYENCQFVNCNFSGSDLSEIKFADCSFEGCDLSMIKLGDTALREVSFIDVRLLGARFEDCNPFGFAVHFEDCQLDLCSFIERKMKGAQFVNCSLREADFTGTDLSDAVFEACDLSRATFENTTLHGADLSSASNFEIDPEVNRIRKARFSPAGALGLLRKYDIEIE